MENRYIKVINAVYKIANYKSLYAHNKRTYGSDDVFYETELHVLEQIVNKNDITILELVDIFYKTKSCMSQTISSLAQKGLITKEKSGTDSRKNIYKVTEKGLRLHDTHMQYDKKQTVRLKRALAGYAASDIAKIMQLLEKYHKFQLENKDAITTSPLRKK